MLPKVANHILHQTTRAAAVVQSHSTHTIRNVLRTDTTTNLPPWNGSSSSSNWGNNGTGPGSAKYNAGSRFQNGYTGAGRAVTHANAITSQDQTFGRDDDSEEFQVKRVSLIRRPKPKSPRLRSHSLSVNAQERNERGENLGVLESVQIHARSRHAFAQAPSSNVDHMLLASGPIPSVTTAPTPVLVRRNSTSVTREQTSSSEPPLSPPANAASSSPSTDPAAPQSVAPPQPASSVTDDATYMALCAALESQDPAQVVTTVANFVESDQNPSVAQFNKALEALHETRRAGEPLTLILDTYNAMLARSLIPNFRTYFILMLALTDRDHEVHRMTHSLSVRSDKRMISGTTPPSSPQIGIDQTRVEQLKRENNFGSALSLFEATIAIDGNSKLPGMAYNQLLRACSYHASVDSAIHVFAQLEARKDIRPSALTYLYMMSTYTNANDANGARAVFDEFLSAAKEGRVVWNVAPCKPEKQIYDPSKPLQRSTASRNIQLQIWNKMIEASFRSNPPVPVDAISLFETMLNSPAPPLFGPSDVPPPASSTYTTIINGFVSTGDLDSALSWFDNLLKQADPPRNPFESTKRPVRPDVVAWMTILDALAFASNKDFNRVDDLNRLFRAFCANANRDGLEVRIVDRLITFQANMNHMRDIPRRSFSPSQRDTLKARLDFLVQYVLSEKFKRPQAQNMIHEVVTAYLQLGHLPSAINLLELQIADEMNTLDQQRTEGIITPEVAGNAQTAIQNLAVQRVQEIYDIQRQSDQDLPFGAAIQLARICDKIGVLPSLNAQAAELLHSYGVAKRDGQIVNDLASRDWELLAYAAAEMELPQQDGSLPSKSTIKDYAFAGGVVELLEDMAKNNVNLQQLQQVLVQRMVQAIFLNKGVDVLKATFKRMGPAYEQFLANPQRELDALAEAVATSPVSESDNGSVETDSSTLVADLRINPYTTQFIDELLQVTKENRKPDPLTAYARFEAELQKGITAGPAVLGRLIQGLGRLGEVDKVREVYTVAQSVLMSLEYNKKWQSQAWFMIEDSMIIALAHAGDIDSAHVHRIRILDQGGAPTADAYGALILYVKDTTDDTSNAMALFQEAQSQNVAPNLYLYNNIISKLAKARKADYALELFQEMKAAHIRPSSITYGALIGACARVGDVHSAEILFDEMTKQTNFKPRIPPYNTMMQLYTTTKPNRDRALFYYNALLRAGIRPTAHTYKLLLDTYGTIEPVDINAMEDVFKHLEEDSNVAIQGAHWAAVINAWGCVVKDLDKAIETFDAIATHPSTLKSSTPLPDAVVFEAMINVLVAHHRTDLIPHFLEKLNAAGIHMTAYIANCLIKGYALNGELDHARSIFESLQDPPEGVAAPHNHAPHQPTQSTKVEVMAPVYREPSTWEVMVRAELGAGNRDNALFLLERLQARQYPDAVYNRISGIMLDYTTPSP
ncbi:hypothetical protein PC9H_005503 [Pleurotus ostreatus]|uniref:PROP1-like PPR domain-containing protein n=1 Tax=Pleurotus ostreatus TaxID=5322 RepID=A0A8H6ZWL8_PLEOS|nr:uncharacterized protein PC9H_005503 [Pleurotus ostreatus]KAF7433545.1 hypothetical protein PC9H_005503 [Pleurotus ostreatus]